MAIEHNLSHVFGRTCCPLPLPGDVTPSTWGFLPMLSRIVRAFALVLVVFLVLGRVTWAQSTPDASVSQATQTLTITIGATLGPVLSGSDPIGADGQSGTVTILASESLSPTKHTKNFATYTLPAGAITAIVGGETFTSTSPAKMTIKLAKKADTLTLIFASSIDGFKFTITDTTALAPGSWTTAVLEHPEVFTPSPQTLTAAESATGPGSKFKYTFEGTATVLGVSGTASSSAASDPDLPDDDLDQ